MNSTLQTANKTHSVPIPPQRPPFWRAKKTRTDIGPGSAYEKQWGVEHTQRLRDARAYYRPRQSRAQDVVPTRPGDGRKIDYLMAGLEVPPLEKQRQSSRPAERDDLGRLEQMAEQFNRRQILKSGFRAVKEETELRAQQRSREEMNRVADQFNRRQRLKAGFQALKGEKEFRDRARSHHRQTLELIADTIDRRKLQRDALHTLKSTLEKRRQTQAQPEEKERFLSQAARNGIQAWVNDVDTECTDVYDVFTSGPEKPSFDKPPAPQQPTLDREATRRQRTDEALDAAIEDARFTADYIRTHTLPNGKVWADSTEGMYAVVCAAQIIQERRRPPNPKYELFGLALEETMEAIHQRFVGWASRTWTSIKSFWE